MNKTTKERAWELYLNWCSDLGHIENLTVDQRLSVFEQVAIWAQEAAITFEHTEL